MLDLFSTLGERGVIFDLAAIKFKETFVKHLFSRPSQGSVSIFRSCACNTALIHFAKVSQ